MESRVFVSGVTEMLVDNLHTRHRLSPKFILYNCSIIVYSMTFIRCWALSQSSVTRNELSRQIHANILRVRLPTLNIAQFLNGLVPVLQNSASSNVPHNLFAKKPIVKNLSLVTGLSYLKKNVK